MKSVQAVRHLIGILLLIEVELAWAAPLHRPELALRPFRRAEVSTWPDATQQRILPESVERTIAVADKYFPSRPDEDVIDDKLGLYGLSDPEDVFDDVLQGTRRLFEQGFPKFDQTANQVTILIPDSEVSFTVDLTNLTNLLRQRRKRLTIEWESPTTTGKMHIGPAELVLVSTGDQPFLAAELKVRDLAMSNYYTIGSEPVPEGSYWVEVQLGWAGRGDSKRDLWVYLPMKFFEESMPGSEAPPSDHALASAMLLETAIEIARRVAAQQGWPPHEVGRRAELLRRELSQADGPLGRAGLTDGLQELDALETREERVWTRALREPGERGFPPSELGLAYVVRDAPHRIVEYLEMLDRLVDLWQRGQITMEEPIVPHAPRILSGLAGIAMRNRFSWDFLGHLEDLGLTYRVNTGAIPLTMLGQDIEDWHHADASFIWPYDSPMTIGLAQFLFTRDVSKVEGLLEQWNANRENVRLRDRPEAKLQELFWRNQLSVHLRAEHAHLCDILMLLSLDLGAVEVRTRMAFRESQDFLEALLTRFTPTGVVWDERPLEPAELDHLAMIISERILRREESESYQQARQMLGQILPRLYQWAAQEHSSRSDLYQTLLWFKLLLFMSTSPEGTIDLVASSSTSAEFLESASEPLVERLYEMRESRVRGSVISFTEQLFRELKWITAYRHEHQGYFPRLHSPIPGTIEQAHLGEQGEMRPVVDDPARRAAISAKLNLLATMSLQDLGMIYLLEESL